MSKKMNVVVNVTGSNMTLSAPFNEHWVVKARSLSGVFIAGAWSFDSRLENLVREAAFDIFGCDGTRIDQCTIELKVDDVLYDAKPGRQDAVYFLGRPLARAFGRDSGAKLGEGVVVLSGGFGSGGSAKNWTTTIKPDTVVLLHDMPRVAVQSLIDLGREYIKIIDQDNKKESPAFDFVHQERVVAKLLDNILAVLPSIPEGEKKGALIASLRTFEYTSAITTWNVSDIIERLKNGICERDAKAVLGLFSSRYGTAPEDFESIDTAYGIWQAQQADTTPSRES